MATYNQHVDARITFLPRPLDGVPIAAEPALRLVAVMTSFFPIGLGRLVGEFLQVEPCFDLSHRAFVRWDDLVGHRVFNYSLCFLRDGLSVTWAPDVCAEVVDFCVWGYPRINAPPPPNLRSSVPQRCAGSKRCAPLSAATGATSQLSLNATSLGAS